MKDLSSFVTAGSGYGVVPACLVVTYLNENDGGQAMESDARRIKRLREAGRYIVTGVRIYSQGTVEVVRRAEPGNSSVDAERGSVRQFSRSSRERLAFVSRETMAEFSSLMTLSYGKQYPLSGPEVKVHLNRFLNWYRRWVGGQYIWWLEFQERGAPHMHIASQQSRVTWYDREEFADRWATSQGLTYGLYYTDLGTRTERNLYDDVVAVHAHKRQWEAARKSDGPKRYIIKYALKMRQKTVPLNYRNVGRFWGCSRAVTYMIPQPKDVEICEADLRNQLKAQGHMSADWECIPKTLWGAKIVSRETIGQV